MATKAEKENLKGVFGCQFCTRLTSVYRVLTLGRGGRSLSKYAGLLYAQPSFMEGVGRLVGTPRDCFGWVRLLIDSRRGRHGCDRVVGTWCAVADLRAVLDFAKRYGIEIPMAKQKPDDGSAMKPPTPQEGDVAKPGDPPLDGDERSPIEPEIIGPGEPRKMRTRVTVSASYKYEGVLPPPE